MQKIWGQNLDDISPEKGMISQVSPFASLNIYFLTSFAPSEAFNPPLIEGIVLCV